MKNHVNPSTVRPSSIPDPPSDQKENYVTPCYEQLVAAYYALCRAEDIGFGTRNTAGYHPVGLYAAVRDLSGGRAPTNPFWQAWLAGFYFNSALHRVSWACERLLEFFAGLPVADESPSPREFDGFGQLILAVRGRLTNSKLGDHSGGIRAMCDCVAAFWDRGVKKKQQLLQHVKKTQVSRENVLAVLRWRVNIQKHAMHGITYPEEYSAHWAEGSWGKPNNEDRDRLNWAWCAFEIVCGAYQDVHYLYFESGVLVTPDRAVLGCGVAVL